jgi:DNA-binding XRE family transcriptional regulator
MPTLKDFRERALLSQSELARMIGVHQETIHTWESGRFKPIPRYQRKLVEVFHCTPDELVAAIKETKAAREAKEARERREQAEQERPAA